MSDVDSESIAAAYVTPVIVEVDDSMGRSHLVPDVRKLKWFGGSQAGLLIVYRVEDDWVREVHFRHPITVRVVNAGPAPAAED